MTDGAYFVSARTGTSQKSGRPFGLVEVVVVEGGMARCQSLWCRPEVAEAASKSCEVFDAVTLRTRAGYRGFELVEVQSA